MNILEKEIEDIVWDYANDKDKRPKLQQRGLYGIFPVNFRQVDLGTYGRADMISVQRTSCDKYNTSRLIINVIELKKDEINASVFFQAIRYCRGIERMLNKKYNLHEIKFQITLIGKTIDTRNDFCYITDIFPQVFIYTYEIDMEKGILFSQQSGFYKHNEMRGCINFEDKKKIRDLIIHQQPTHYFT